MYFYANRFRKNPIRSTQRYFSCKHMSCDLEAQKASSNEQRWVDSPLLQTTTKTTSALSSWGGCFWQGLQSYVTQPITSSISYIWGKTKDTTYNAGAKVVEKAIDYAHQKELTDYVAKSIFENQVYPKIQDFIEDVYQNKIFIPLQTEAESSSIKERKSVVDPSSEELGLRGLGKVKYVEETNVIEEIQDIASEIEPPSQENVDWREKTSQECKLFVSKVAVYSNALWIAMHVLGSEFSLERDSDKLMNIVEDCTASKTNFIDAFKKHFKPSWFQRTRVFFLYYFCAAPVANQFISSFSKNILDKFRDKICSDNEEGRILALSTILRHSNSFLEQYLGYLQLYSTAPNKGDMSKEDYVQMLMNKTVGKQSTKEVVAMFSKVMAHDLIPNFKLLNFLKEGSRKVEWNSKLTEIGGSFWMYVGGLFAFGIAYIYSLFKLKGESANISKRINALAKNEATWIIESTTNSLLDLARKKIQEPSYRHLINQTLVDQVKEGRFKLVNLSSQGELSAEASSSSSSQPPKLSKDKAIQSELRKTTPVLIQIAHVDHISDADELEKLFRKGPAPEGFLENKSGDIPFLGSLGLHKMLLKDITDEETTKQVISSLELITPELLNHLLYKIMHNTNESLKPSVELTDIEKKKLEVEYHNTAVELEKEVNLLIQTAIDILFKQLHESLPESFEQYTVDQAQQYIDNIDILLANLPSMILPKDKIPQLKLYLKEKLNDLMKQRLHLSSKQQTIEGLLRQIVVKELPSILSRDYLQGINHMLTNPLIYEGLATSTMTAFVDQSSTLKQFFGINSK